MQRNQSEMNNMNKDLAQSIGRVAREARKALQLTQEDAAERIRVSVEFYARIERGTSLPSIGTFARIASALGISADAMLSAATQPGAGAGTAWAPPPPTDGPEVRRLVRRLRKARPATLRLVGMLVKELEDNSASNQSADAIPDRSDPNDADELGAASNDQVVVASPTASDDDGGMRASSPTEGPRYLRESALAL
ncbi:helix-turn-helix domain-containing protein [Haliangium sp.]|uniref:helix-turn-helix domain-containing protein n=1 Tax=Haliangium sp. TaxID=2663208 RepID=UPI003D11940F